MGSLLEIIYSRLLHEIRLWVAMAEIGTDAIMSRYVRQISCVWGEVIKPGLDSGLNKLPCVNNLFTARITLSLHVPQ